MERIDALKKLLTEFHFAAEKRKDKNEILWYHALVIDLLLDTCHHLITYDESCSFYLDLVSSSYFDKNNHEAVSRFIANFWLWSVTKSMREWSERLMEEMCVRVLN